MADGPKSEPQQYADCWAVIHTTNGDVVACRRGTTGVCGKMRVRANGDGVKMTSGTCGEERLKDAIAPRKRQ